MRQPRRRDAARDSRPTVRAVGAEVLRGRLGTALETGPLDEGRRHRVKEPFNRLEVASDGSVERLLDEVVAFGIAGTLIVLAATSLSRALTRAFAAIWVLPRPRTKLESAWRWLAVALVLAVSLTIVAVASEPAKVLPPRDLWPLVVSFGCDIAVALFVPWVLLAGAVHPRLLAPGATLFALLMLAARPVAAAWLPRALDSSSDLYWSMGVAFTYIAILYVGALCFLATFVLGRVIATDTGAFGAWIRQARSVGEVTETVDEN